MGDAQTRLAFDFSGAREIRYVSGVPEVGDFITRRQELWVVRKIEEDGGGLVISCELPRTESKDSSGGGAGTQRL